MKAHRSFLALILGVAFLMVTGVAPAETATTSTIQLRGLVLPLYAADPEFDYGFALREIAETGANAVILSVVLLQQNAASTEIYQKAGRTAPDDVVVNTIAEARSNHLQVMLFPIVLLENPEEDDWRGNLKPESTEAWFLAYEKWMMHYAGIAQQNNCEWFSVGSEYSSLEKYSDEWKQLIQSVRETYRGNLLYSCNWDHLAGPSQWWPDLDAVGLSSYYELTSDPDASQEELDASWRAWRRDVLDWHGRTVPHLPIIFTEVGYPSMDGAAVYPWDYTLDKAPDFEEQRRCYQAFIAAWHGQPQVKGVFFYKWLSFDADNTRGYSPRGKPAEFVMRAWFALLSGNRADQ